MSYECSRALRPRAARPPSLAVAARSVSAPTRHTCPPRCLEPRAPPRHATWPRVSARGPHFAPFLARSRSSVLSQDPPCTLSRAPDRPQTSNCNELLPGYISKGCTSHPLYFLVSLRFTVRPALDQPSSVMQPLPHWSATSPSSCPFLSQAAHLRLPQSTAAPTRAASSPCLSRAGPAWPDQYKSSGSSRSLTYPQIPHLAPHSTPSRPAPPCAWPAACRRPRSA